jgi:hypothetical protein
MLQELQVIDQQPNKSKLKMKEIEMQVKSGI